jgi:hypothetical protein
MAAALTSGSLAITGEPFARISPSAPSCGAGICGIFDVMREWLGRAIRLCRASTGSV